MNNPNFFPKKLIQRTCSVLSKHIQTVKSGVHPMIIRWHFFMIPVMLENQDLRPRLSPRPTSLLLHHHSPPTPIKSGWVISYSWGFPPHTPECVFRSALPLSTEGTKEWYKDYRLTFQCDSQ